jgi:hypothetical protein
LRASLTLPAAAGAGSLPGQTAGGSAAGSLERGDDHEIVAAAAPYAGMLKRSAEQPELSARVLRAWLKES